MRQDDHLSPLLLCLAEEVLCKYISKLVNDKKILHMASPKDYITPSLILYGDDISVFYRANNKSLKNLSIFLQNMVIFLVSM